jgi:hypothetical protein
MIYKIVLLPRKDRRGSITETSRLLLFMEVIAVNYENGTKLINVPTLCRQNAELF